MTHGVSKATWYGQTARAGSETASSTLKRQEVVDQPGRGSQPQGTEGVWDFTWLVKNG